MRGTQPTNFGWQRSHWPNTTIQPLIDNEENANKLFFIKFVLMLMGKIKGYRYLLIGSLISV